MLSLTLSACLPALTLVSGVAGVGDSLYKTTQIGQIERRLDAMEKKLNKNKVEPYVPSYVDMESFNKGLLDDEWNKNRRKN
tara:strand:+ start:261 stop:503 length:243 start_codon:yes stop_codon:yes gene_type:complete